MKKLDSDEKKVILKLNLMLSPLVYKVITGLPVAETTDSLIAKALFCTLTLVAPSISALFFIMASRLLVLVASKLIDSAFDMINNDKSKKSNKKETVIPNPNFNCEIIQFPTKK